MKTIEEKAKEYAEKKFESIAPLYDLDSNDIKKLFESVFKAGVEFGQRWIPVEEELPEVGELVQIKFNLLNEHLHFDHDKVIDVNGNKMFEIEQIMVNVTHWRPIEYK